jgi:hypothetical protein
MNGFAVKLKAVVGKLAGAVRTFFEDNVEEKIPNLKGNKVWLLHKYFS